MASRLALWIFNPFFPLVVHELLAWAVVRSLWHSVHTRMPALTRLYVRAQRLDDTNVHRDGSARSKPQTTRSAVSSCSRRTSALVVGRPRT